MTGAYSTIEDDYLAHKKRIDSFNRDLERKLAEAEDEELATILSTFSQVLGTTKTMIVPKQQEGSD